MRIVHLPFYDDNPYQQLLMDAQRSLGHDVRQGGGGGNFLGVAMREWHADLIHFHWLHPYLLRSTAAATILRATRFIAEVSILKARGARIVWTIHNLVNHDHHHPWLDRYFSVIFAKLTDVCFVHSHSAAAAAADRFSIPPSKLHVIPHGNYIGPYANTITREAAREALALPDSSNVFLFLGRIEPYKGINNLIDAFLELPGEPHLVVAGKIAEPQELARLETRINDCSRIHLHPRRIPDAELQTLFHAADYVVFPFKEILTSGSLVLAMSFAKAVIAPKLPSLVETLPAEGVVWFNPNNPGSLSEALALASAQSSRSTQSGAANFDRARQWPWTSVAEMIMNASTNPSI